MVLIHAEADEDAAWAYDPNRVWARFAEYLTPTDAALIRIANYVFRSRVAESWCQWPVLLAGDAAHEMPPLLAQGKCSGIRDAPNIGCWKLDLVLRGLAAEGLLDSYQPEREPHVRFITEKAINWAEYRRCATPSWPASVTAGCSSSGGATRRRSGQGPRVVARGEALAGLDTEARQRWAQLGRRLAGAV